MERVSRSSGTLLNAWFALYQCDNCGYGAVGATLLSSYDAGQSYEAERLFEDPGQAIRWLPDRPRGKKFEHVPEHIAGAASEAHAVASIDAYRSALILARAVIEAIAKDQGVTVRGIAPKIDALREQEKISAHLHGTANEIRDVGNDMAHGDFDTEITEDDVNDVLTFMDEALHEVYQGPARLEARRALRAKRNGASNPDK